MERAFKSAFHLDQKFIVDLHQRLEQKRRNANERYLSIFNSIVEALNREATGGRYELGDNSKAIHPPEVIPDIEHLAQLVDTTFWASFEKEEGRPLSFTVAFMQPEQGSERLVVFGEPLPYDVRGLAKLAPAIGTAGGALLVGPFARGELKIWGLINNSAEILNFKVIDPGSVIITYRVLNVAAISRSEAVLIRDPLLTHSSAIWSRFRPGDENSEYDLWADPRTGAVLQTVMAMRALGHGGTLVIVPNSDSWQRSVKLPIPYAGDGLFSPFGSSIAELRDVLRDKEKTFQEEMYWRWVISEICRKLAQLTAVDGATLVTYDLDVIGFGAKLEPAPGSQAPSYVVNVDPLDHANWVKHLKPEQLGNTRHQSAARFVAEQKDAIAFVVSQDGEVTALAWGQPADERRLQILYAYRRLELTLL